MCDKCQQIDVTMARYRRLAGQIGDQQTVDTAHRLLEKLEAEKRALHPPK
jgi:hypothetical protein